MSYLKLFSNCIIVSGVKNALICDLQRNESELIPSEIGKVLKLLSSKISIEDVLSRYNEEESKIVNEYIRYMIEKEYAFQCDFAEFDLFPDLSRSYEVPYEITNAIIERNQENIIELGKLVDELENLGCQHISIIIYDQLSHQNFNFIFNQFRNRKLKSCDIVSKWNREINEYFFNTVPANIQLSHLSFFGTPIELTNYSFDGFHFGVFFSGENISNFSGCGRVNIQSFNTNLPKVLEAINFNSCLYKKITIDSNGNIRNCPSMPQKFGNINKSTIKEALNHTDFKKYWRLTKDKIEVCNECEFRYICTDCRAYTERTHFDKNGLDKSKPLKCGYNPYTGEWEEWSSNPLKNKTMQFYGIIYD